MSNSIEISIIIPTRNRENFLKNNLRNLINLIRNKNIEIIISNNSDLNFELPEFEDSRINLIRPPQLLNTAEENLFFALPLAKGKYIWPLGDDDIVQRHSFEKLWDLCSQNYYDVMTWNASNVRSDYFPLGWSRILSTKESLEMRYSQFLERCGFWSISAGISLTIFKRELLIPEILQEVQSFKNKIYSHVTLYARLFRDAKFAFINHDLVKYRTNDFDVKHNTADHWTRYSKSQNVFDRFFWTKGFIEQLRWLEESGSISKNYLSKTLDIGHFNNRLPLLEHIITLLINQIENDAFKTSAIPISSDELNEVLIYLERLAPNYVNVYDQLINIKLDIISNSRLARKNIMNLKNSWNNYMQAYPFNRFYIQTYNGYFVYNTPLGWLALPFQTNTSLHGVPQVANLVEMLRGIDFPSIEGVFVSSSYEGLIEELKNLKMNSETLRYMMTFHSIPEQFQFNSMAAFNSPLLLKLSRNTAVLRVWSFLPLRIKRYIRQRILS